MRIFGKKRKKEEDSGLTLAQARESRQYDLFAALAKALMLFLLVYGALGGLLSAFGLEYNKGLCMLVLFGLALLLSAVYEAEKKWLTNLVSILLFMVYLYAAVSNYWVINSGYYAILNRIYESAREYLRVAGGVEYTLAVEETYATVTMFVIFFGMVGVILFNILLHNKCGLLRVAALTLPPYVLPLYLERPPELLYVILLFSAYMAAAALSSGTRDKMTRRIRYALPFAIALTALVVRGTAFLLPEARYGMLVPASEAKEDTRQDMARLAQYGMMALFWREGAGTGIGGGMLSRASYVMPSYETVLTVRYTPYDLQPVYLKAFTGKDYLGDRWSRAGDIPPDDGKMAGSVQSRVDSYNGDDGNGDDAAGALQGRGIMEVEKADASDEYEYIPYYTDETETRQQGNTAVYTYYPAGRVTGPVFGEISDAYLEVPSSCGSAVRKVCEEAGFTGTEEEIAAQITAYFDENYSYTMRPGFYIGNPDYISHFLLESKRGYCVHFASAAVMLLRQMGVPARYVEGYAFSYQNVVDSGTLVEGAAYEDYYDGYAPMGETALIELDIPDAYAHAWVEIYVEGKGWLVVDPTPAQTAEDDTTSFWEAFMNGNGERGPEMAQNDLGEYLESALGGISYGLLTAAVLLLAGFGIVNGARAVRERKLPGRERARLEYGRLQSYLGRKHPEYRKLRTLREQLDWMKDHGFPGIGEEQEKTLYQAYFAESADEKDCEELRRQLKKLRGRRAGQL